MSTNDAIAHPAMSRDAFGRQGFGAMRLRDEAVDDADRDPIAVVHAALDAGITMIDTADAYQNEELVGRAIRGRREEVLLASKFGLVWTDEVASGFDVRADRAYVHRASEASLRRLDAEVIDVYYLHHRSETVPIEETVGAMAELVTQGKVRALGLSNVTAADLRRAVAVHPIVALQEQWSLLQRDVEQQMLPTAAELGVVSWPIPPPHTDSYTRPSVPPASRQRAVSVSPWTRSPGPTMPRLGRSHWHRCTTDSKSTRCRSYRYPGRPASAIYAQTSPPPI